MGGEPTWEVMFKRYDCDRKITRTLVKEIGNSLEKRRQDTFNIYHSPGAGGSTIAKRALWEQHESYPTGELLAISPANNIAACMSFITQKTSKSLLLLLDTGRFNYDDIQKIHEKIRAEQLPVVILQVTRRFDAQHNFRTFRS